MNKVNFDSLKSIKAPQEWIEKAAAIPGTAPERKAAFPFYRVAAAASIVLVSVVGLVIFLFFGSGSAPVVISGREPAASEAFADETAAETGETDTSAPAETAAVLSTDAQGNTVIRYAAATEPTAAGAQPTEAQTTATAPTAAQNSTEKSTPTAPAAERTTAPTEAPAPTNAPDPTKPTEAPAPTELPSPTEAPYHPPTDYRIYATVTFLPEVGAAEPAIEEGMIYCCLYDALGNIVGRDYHDGWQKAAKILSVNEDSSYNVVYDPVEKGLSIKSGRYEYVFYDMYGEELCRGTVDYK